MARSPLFRERRVNWSLSDLLLRVPVVQAPLGSCDGPRLAGAVSRAGALGCLTVHATPVDRLKLNLKRLRAITSRPVLVALTAPWDRDEVMETCLAAGIRHFQVFWWNGPRQSPRIRAAGGQVFWQVGSVPQALDALEVGADVLVAQGTEAGGQVRSPHPLRQLLTDILMASEEKVPVVAGGGLADAADVRKVLAWGASAALLGTRFLMSSEARSSARHKSRLAHASTEDLVLDPRLIGDWPCAPRRRLITARNEDCASLFAGCGLSRIHNILPVAEIVNNLARALPPSEEEV